VDRLEKGKHRVGIIATVEIGTCTFEEVNKRISTRTRDRDGEIRIPHAHGLFCRSFLVAVHEEMVYDKRFERKKKRIFPTERRA